MEVGAVFQPELITLMKSVLEEAAASLPEAKRTSSTKADMATVILARAAKGERDWTALKMAALSPSSTARTIRTIFHRIGGLSETNRRRKSIAVYPDL